MPADSRTLADEGVVIEPRVLDDDAIAELSGQMRRPDQRRADLRAQLAAAASARCALRRARTSASASTRCARRYAEVLDYAERRTRACLRELDDGERTRRGRAGGARGRPARSSLRATRRAATR